MVLCEEPRKSIPLDVVPLCVLRQYCGGGGIPDDGPTLCDGRTDGSTPSHQFESIMILFYAK